MWSRDSVGSVGSTRKNKGKVVHFFGSEGLGTGLSVMLRFVSVWGPQVRVSRTESPMEIMHPCTQWSCANLLVTTEMEIRSVEEGPWIRGSLRARLGTGVGLGGGRWRSEESRGSGDEDVWV